MTLILFFSLALSCSAQKLAGVPPYVKSARDVAEWFSRDFKYQFQLTGRVTAVQTPQETIKLKAGQCGDFALLASRVLTNLGVPNCVIVIKFKGLNVRHAICAWKDIDGAYSFISNQKLYQTQEKNIEEAVKKAYPEYEGMSLQVFDEKKIVLRSKD